MNNSCEIQKEFQWTNVLNSSLMANVQMELELLEIPRSGFSNHRLKMTRALSDQVLRDFRSRNTNTSRHAKIMMTVMDIHEGLLVLVLVPLYSSTCRSQSVIVETLQRMEGILQGSLDISRLSERVSCVPRK